MKIAELIDGLPIVLAGGSGQAEIGGVTEDSRLAGAGDLFVARRGSEVDGHEFIPQAVKSGVVAVLAERRQAVPAGTTTLVPTDRSASLAALGATLADRLLGEPSRHLDVVGVTGTNGKTTTTHLIHQILEAAGTRCGLVGTVHIDEGNGPRPARLTTPSALELAGSLASMVEAECGAAVLEVSSHALEQDRVAAVRFDGAVFTNLSGDHLDYHGSMESYFESKARLFEMLPADAWAVLNADDRMSTQLRTRCKARVLTCGLHAARADCRAKILNRDDRGTDIALTGPWGEMKLVLPLVGGHNVMNAMEAAAVAHQLGVSQEAIEDGLRRCVAPPGRLEPVTSDDDPFTVLVDYAHTDDALDNVLREVKPLVQGRLRVVFGCGGDRDATKRPRMATAAWRHADEVIITSDNPRTESAEAIIEQAFVGVPMNRTRLTTRITDRREAIETAIERSTAGDVVVIAGKGHEDYQIIGSTKRPFDDRVVAREAMQRETEA
jgi:UDP-N-acetylmuramoyl-L-alanyl-D-glutamate--2,6-diaminopimelate ligase